jgi:hypothetical protein
VVEKGIYSRRVRVSMGRRRNLHYAQTCKSVVSIDLGNNMVRNMYPEGAVPTSCTKCHSVSANTQAADSVFVASQHPNTLAFEGVPNIACPVIIAAEQDAP